MSEAAVACVCLTVLQTTLGGVFRSLFFARGDRKPETIESFVSFSHQLIGNQTHVSSQHQGDREGGENTGLTGKIGTKKGKGRTHYPNRQNKSLF